MCLGVRERRKRETVLCLRVHTRTNAQCLGVRECRKGKRSIFSRACSTPSAMSKGATLQRAEPRLLPYHVATVPRVATQGVTCCNHTNVLRNTVQRGAASAAVPPDGMLLALRLCGNTVRCERHAPSCFARSGVFLLAALSSFRHTRLADPVAHQADQRSFLHARQIARACVKRLLALYECSVYQ